MRYKFKLEWFFFGLFVLWILEIAAFVMGTEPDLKLSALSLPLIFWITFTIFDYLNDNFNKEKKNE